MRDERLLEGMQVVAIYRQPLDGDNLGMTRRPSSKMVQAPHCPWSQPFLGPVTPSRSRSASRSVVLVSTDSRCVAPLTRRVISRSIVYVSPLALLVISRDLNKHWLQKSESHSVMSEHVGGARRVFPHAMAHPAGFGPLPS